MKTIIIATDYSAVGHNATRYAAALATRMKAKLILYHAFYFQETFSKILIDIPTLHELKMEHEEKLEAIKNDITQTYQLPVTVCTSELPIEDELPKVIARYEADVVVMGMRHTNIFDRKVFGSVATAVINQTTCPVLLVPENAYFSEPKTILFPYDFPAIAIENTFELLKQLTMTFHAQLLLLHVEQAEPEPVEENGNGVKKYSNLENILQGVKHAYTFVDENDIAAGISKAIHKYQADLLVMVPQKHGFWSRVRNSSITRQMAFQTHIPLLTLPNPPDVSQPKAGTIENE